MSGYYHHYSRCFIIILIMKGQGLLEEGKKVETTKGSTPLPCHDKKSMVLHTVVAINYPRPSYGNGEIIFIIIHHHGPCTTPGRTFLSPPLTFSPISPLTLLLRLLHLPLNSISPFPLYWFALVFLDPHERSSPTREIGEGKLVR